MSSVAELFKRELLSRLQALPLSAYGATPPLADNIRRSHRTIISRERAPAIHLRFGKARPIDDKACEWQWSLDWTASVFGRSDNDEDTDPIVIEVVNRISPLTTPYSAGVSVDFIEIDTDTEIADEDAQRVDVIGVAKFTTAAWSLKP